MGAYRRTDSDVLDRTSRPIVLTSRHMHADDRVGPDELRLLLQPCEGAQAGGVPRFGDNGQLLRDPARLPTGVRARPLLPADVIDRTAHHLHQRPQPDRAHQRELVDRQSRTEQTAPGLPDLAQTLLGAQRQLAPLQRRQRGRLLRIRRLARLPPLRAAAPKQRHRH